MNNNESPLTVAEQIEVLEAAKKKLVDSAGSYFCIGLCCAINCVIREDYNHLAELAAHGGLCNVIPSFTFENAVLSGTVDNYAVPYWYWWSTEVSKGGITNRLAFLDYLINNLKNEDHE